jgi:adenylate kinase
MLDQTQFHVIYLTGAPATGKTTLGSYLTANVQPLNVFYYSRLLTDYLMQKHAGSFSHEQLRRESAKLIERSDITAVDQLLVEQVREKRRESHVIIDSHAVTKEGYGYRVTPFTSEVLKQLQPTMICMLYTEPSVVVDRIGSGGEGRSSVSLFEAAFHSELQASVALFYALTLDIPIYILDGNLPVANLAVEIVKRLQAKNPNTQYKSQ